MCQQQIVQQHDFEGAGIHTSTPPCSSLHDYICTQYVYNFKFTRAKVKQVEEEANKSNKPRMITAPDVVAPSQRASFAVRPYKIEYTTSTTSEPR